MEKKTGRSRKAVQSLKPKKLVYWAVAIPAFLALLLFAIVFLKNIDEPEHNSKTVHLKTDFKKYRPGTILCFFILISSITDGIFCGYYNMNQLFLDRIHITVATIGLFFSASYFINSAAYLLVGFILKILNRKYLYMVYSYRDFCFCY